MVLLGGWGLEMTFSTSREEQPNLSLEAGRKVEVSTLLCIVVTQKTAGTTVKHSGPQRHI